MLSADKMVTAIQVAQDMARKAIESTYDSSCTIIEYRSKKNKETKITSDVEEIVVKDCCCKLSFEKNSSAIQTNTITSITQAVKLLISPDIIISSGSKIMVTTKNETISYGASSKPAVYKTHQEIILKLSKEWA